MLQTTFAHGIAYDASLGVALGFDDGSFITIQSTGLDENDLRRAKCGPEQAS